MDRRFGQAVSEEYRYKHCDTEILYLRSRLDIFTNYVLTLNSHNEFFIFVNYTRTYKGVDLGQGLTTAADKQQPSYF